jgi:hypothetical protein
MGWHIRASRAKGITPKGDRREGSFVTLSLFKEFGPAQQQRNRAAGLMLFEPAAPFMAEIGAIQSWDAPRFSG